MFGLDGVQIVQMWARQVSCQTRQHNQSSLCIWVMVEKGVTKQQKGQCPEVKVSRMLHFTNIKLMWYNPHVDLQQALSDHHRRPVGGLNCALCSIDFNCVQLQTRFFAVARGPARVPPHTARRTTHNRDTFPNPVVTWVTCTPRYPNPFGRGG